MKIENVTKKTVIASDAARADSFASRGRGLMFTSSLVAGSGLVIEPCNSIHMFFMRYPLDVIFTDREGKVLFMHRGIKPWRMGRVVRGAKAAVELPVGSIDGSGTQEGDLLRFSA